MTKIELLVLDIASPSDSDKCKHVVDVDVSVILTRNLLLHAPLQWWHNILNNLYLPIVTVMTLLFPKILHFAGIIPSTEAWSLFPKSCRHNYLKPISDRQHFVLRENKSKELLITRPWILHIGGGLPTDQTWQTSSNTDQIYGNGSIQFPAGCFLPTLQPGWGG